MKMKNAHRWAFITAAAGMLLLAPIAAAASGSTATIAAGETHSGNFIDAARTVNIDGRVTGDVIVAGGTIVISGAVDGDVLAAGQTVRITGSVGGSVRVIASDVTVDGPVGHNVTVAGSTVTLGSGAAVAWDAHLAAATLTADGKVMGELRAAAGEANLRGSVGKDAEIVLGEDGMLTVAPAAVVDGKLTYHSDRDADIAAGAQVGSVVHAAATVPARQWTESIGRWFSLLRYVVAAGVLVLGLALIAVLPNFFGRVSERMRRQAGAAFGWGIGASVLLPLACILLLLTGLGAPLALFLLGLFALAGAAAKVAAAVFVGDVLFRWWWPGKHFNRYVRFLVGFAVFTALTWVPVLGWLLGSALAVWALGALLLTKRDAIRQVEAA